MANLTNTTMFKKLNSQAAMYDADNVDFLIKGLSGTYAEKTSVYTKTEADDKFATKEDISSVYHFKGSVETYQDLKALPTAELKIGDTYNVDESGKNYAWTGVTSAYDEGWDVLGGTFDLSNYYTKGEADGLLSAKVDKVEGMGLSHNDFTDEAVAKVDGAFQTSGGTVSGTAFFNNSAFVSGTLKVSDREADTFTIISKDRFDIATTGQNFKETQYQNGQIFFDNGTVESTISIPAKSGTFALTSDIDSAVSGKVDKVAGMGLSHNDFTDEWKGLVSGALQCDKNEAQHVTGPVSFGDSNGNHTYIDSDKVEVCGDTDPILQVTNEDEGAIGITPTAIQMWVATDGWSSSDPPDGTLYLPSGTHTLATTDDTSAKADKTAFAGLTAFQLVDTSAFDVEELALKYNTLVTVLSGIATTLNP